MKVGIIGAMEQEVALLRSQMNELTTLQLGGCEAVAVGKPLITSDWPYLRELFRGGAIFAPNTGEGLRDAVLAMGQRHAELAREVVAFRGDSRREWDARMRQLEDRVAAALEIARRRA